jgi:class 3 adenylate cyclase/tetratricopeptide (TPR) repeat protein
MSGEACPSCGAENPVGVLFCGRCGSRVGRKCPNCSAVVAPDLAFCTSCGGELEVTAPTTTEERKTVSVLFADLVGFTARAERLDPEEVRELLASYHTRVRTELERFGGTMEKFIGDAAVALFGAPVAHEDDPERAVRAALAVREAMGELDAAVRVGITTGEALVTRDARPLEGEGMAAGDVVNTAARLQAAAPADGILVDAVTYRATQHAIEYREAEPVEAKGKADPISVWEAVAPRARLGVDIAFRGGAALVGRTHELDALRDAFDRACRERTPQLVSLVGTPGIGKSRLVYELSALLDADPASYAFWRQGRSLPYGDGVSFWALGEMAKSHAGILESDDAEVAEEKLRAAVSHAIDDSAEARWIEGHLRPLVGLSGEAGTAERGAEAFSAWRRFFEGLTEQYPVVLVFEDLHWADDGLLDFVDYLLEWATDVPLLVVCTARPELLERRPDWGGGKRNAVTISLSPLSDEESARLLEDLVGKADPAILARAGGNPLYAEEYARMLAQRQNGDELPLPDSVQGIIAARLDRLPLEEKALVQDAAVLGKVFWVGELAQASGLERAAVTERLQMLERKEFIRRERRSSVAEETAYVFRHVLLRDVAYAQIPRRRRAERHRLAAEWIESLAADRREDLADVIAHHYVSALDLARAAGMETAKLAESARLALHEAGDRAASLNAFAGAKRFYRSALDLWPEDDPAYPQLLFRYGRARFFSEDEGEDSLARAAEELLDAGDRASASEAETLVGELRWIAGDRDRAFEHFEGAAALLADEPASRSKAYVLGNHARFLMTGDEAERSIAIGFEAFQMAQELGLEDVEAQVLSTIGVARVMIGDLGGRVDLEQAIAIAEQINSPEVIRGYNNLASTHAALGDLPRAFELYALATRAAERFGRIRALRWLEAERMDELYWRGRWDEALTLADQFVEQAEGGLPHHREVDARLTSGRIRYARGDSAGALEDSIRALAFARRVRDPQTLFPALAFNARMLLVANDRDGAAESATTLLSTWADAGVTFAAFWLADLAVALADLNRTEDLERACAASVRIPTRWLDAALAVVNGRDLEAAGTYAAIGSLPDEAEARLRAAEALAHANRQAEVEAALAPALDFYRSVQATGLLHRAETLVAQRASPG